MFKEEDVEANIKYTKPLQNMIYNTQFVWVQSKYTFWDFYDTIFYMKTTKIWLNLLECYLWLFYSYLSRPSIKINAFDIHLNLFQDKDVRMGKHKETNVNLSLNTIPIKNRLLSPRGQLLSIILIKLLMFTHYYYYYY